MAKQTKTKIPENVSSVVNAVTGEKKITNVIDEPKQIMIHFKKVISEIKNKENLSSEGLIGRDALRLLEAAECLFENIESLEKEQAWVDVAEYEKSHTIGECWISNNGEIEYSFYKGGTFFCDKQEEDYFYKNLIKKVMPIIKPPINQEDRL